MRGVFEQVQGVEQLAHFRRVQSTSSHHSEDRTGGHFFDFWPDRSDRAGQERGGGMREVPSS